MKLIVEAVDPLPESPGRVVRLDQSRSFHHAAAMAPSAQSSHTHRSEASTVFDGFPRIKIGAMCVCRSGDKARASTQHSSQSSIAPCPHARRSPRLRRCSLRTPSAVHRTTRRSSVRSSTACHPVSHHSVAAHPVLDRVHGGARVDLLRRSYAHSARPGHSCRCCRVARRCAAARSACRYSV